MKNPFDFFGKGVSALRSDATGFDFRAIRPSRFVYIFAYVFELMLYCYRGHFFPVQIRYFGVSGNTFILAVHGLASLAVMLLWKKKFRPLIYVSCFITAAGILPYFLLPVGDLRFAFGLLAYAGLGGAVTAARCGFAFALNNSERLLGVFVIFFSCAVIRCADTDYFNNTAVNLTVGVLLLALMCACLFLYKENDLVYVSGPTRRDAKGLYWAFAYFTLYFLVDSFAWAYLNKTDRVEDGFLFIGLMTAGVILLSVLVFIRINLWHVWNIFFVSTVVMALTAMLTPPTASLKPLYFSCGLTMMGWPLSIYVLACSQGQFADLRLLKKCTLIFVLLSPVTNLSADVVSMLFPENYNFVALIVLIAVVVTFLILSPLSFGYLFERRSAAETPQKEKAASSSEETAVNAFDVYELTHRQRQVAELLLQAKTRRQIAGELSLSESTVKTHTSELYKKLGINSRAELFMLFGVRQDSPAESGDDYKAD